MTFVLVGLAFSAQANPGGDIGIDSTNGTSNAPKTAEEIEYEMGKSFFAIDQSPLTKKKIDPLTFAYPFKRSVTARTGLVLDPEKISNGEFPFLIGAAYMLYNNKLPRYEVHTNITTDSIAQVGLSKRYMINEPNHFRSFWSYGVALNIDPEERFATATNIENYFGLAGIGMEDVTNMPKSIRIGIQLQLGIASQSAIAYVGSSWGLRKGN